MSSTWTVILAQEEHRTFSNPCRRFDEDGRPRQLAAIIGTRSMLQHSYEIARRISSSKRILIALTKTQLEWGRLELPNVNRRSFLVLPYDRGTGPALCVAIASIMKQDPMASVLVLPSLKSSFAVKSVEQKIRRVFSCMDDSNIFKPVLIAVRPANSWQGSSWVVPNRRENDHQDCSFYGVEGLFVKPDPITARELFDQGALCNTFVLAARARTIWYILWKHLPRLSNQIDLSYLRILKNLREDDLEETLRAFDSFQFETFLMDRLLPEILAVPLEGVQWFDSSMPH